jgi:Glycosyl transferase family 2
MATPCAICLTPVRNEAPQLESFLAAAATWADAIIVADQASTDGSREIAARHPKVVLVDNTGAGLDESYRQRLLVERARSEFPGARVLIALDADEALTAGARNTSGWRAMLASPPGTPLLMPWINLLPGAQRAWVAPRPKRFGLVDDGSEPAPGLIHNGRLPAGSRPSLALGDLGVVHLQLLDWPRMKAKQRWYQAWERVHLPRTRPHAIYRRYHWMDALAPAQVVPTEPGWLGGYGDVGADLVRRGTTASSYAHWDEAVLELIDAHGAETFRRVDLWDHDWAPAARRRGRSTPADPRRPVDRWVLRALAATQGRNGTIATRVAQQALPLVGW